MTTKNNRDTEKIRVLLAGPFPKPDKMPGTYGRILQNIMNSSVFRNCIQFIPLRMTLPSDGNPLKRELLDIGRFLASLKTRPQILHFIMQKYRAIYREFPILKIAQFIGIKTIIDIRAGTLQLMLKRKNQKIQNAMMRNIIISSSEILLECKKDMEFIQKEFGKKGRYLPNVVLQKDYDRIVPANLCLGQNEPIKLIYSGRYSVEKGLQTVIDALYLLSENKIKTEFHLTGQYEDDELKDKINALQDNPIPHIKVIDHGWDVKDLYQLLASAHVFVMLTTWKGEGHPNSVSEAMMVGLAMILSDWLHRPDIVPDEGAIIIEPNNPDLLYKAILSYVKNPDSLIKAGEINRDFLYNNFLDKDNYRNLLQAYCDNVSV